MKQARSVYIERVRGEGAFRQRISEMGFVKGKKITVVKNAPLNDPVEFSLMGYNVSLRRKEASLIDVSVGPTDRKTAYRLFRTHMSSHADLELIQDK